MLLTTPLSATGVSEPNDTGSEIKFEISSITTRWKVNIGKNKEGLVLYANDPGPIKPTHVARVLLHEDSTVSKNEKRVLERIHESPMAKKFSKSQRDFIETEFAIWVDNDSIDAKPYYYYSIWLYAVTEEDAKLMAQAYLDGLNKYANRIMVDQKRVLSEWQEKLRLAQQELPEKEAKLKDCEKQYKRQKGNVHRFSSDGEASDLAKETILEMDKTLDTLEIELAGIREKLKAIEKYRNEPDQPDALCARLDEMFVEQMIELSGLEARRQMTERLRAEQQVFLALYNERNDLQREVRSLEKTIEKSKNTIKDVSELLDDPRPYMLPPKIYQNTITIYPVKYDQQHISSSDKK
jgi:hypothetical protein